MPALHVFNRRTVFGGDDLQPTVLLNTCFRASQLFLLLLILTHLIHETKYFIERAQNYDPDFDGNDSFLLMYLFGGFIYPDGCSDGSHYFPLLLYLYLGLTIGHILFSLAIEFIINKIANLGTPTQTHLRASLGKVLEKKWIWSSLVGNVLVLSCGIWSFFEQYTYYSCRTILVQNQDEADDNGDGIDGDYFTRLIRMEIWWFALIILLFSQFMEALISLIVLVSLLRQEKAITFISQSYYGPDLQRFHNDIASVSDYEHSIHGLRYDAHHHELVEEMWSERCHNFCKCAAFSTCYLFGGRELIDNMVGDYAQVSRALADYFEDGGVLDLVASDLAAGFVMLQRVQRQRVLEARREIEQEIVDSRGFQDSLRSSNSSMSSNTHNFSIHRSDRTMASMLDNNIDNGGLSIGTSRRLLDHEHLQNLEQGVGSNYPFQNKPIVDDMLNSCLLPMPRSQTLILRDDEKQSSPYDGHDTSPRNKSALMLKMISNDEVRDSQHWYEAQERRVFTRDEEFDRNLIAEGARFARHALSIYTWLLYFYIHPVQAIPKLVAGRVLECCNHEKRSSCTFDARCERQGGCCSGDDGNIIGDNWLHVHKNSLLEHSGLDSSELIYANFENKYNQMPYCIVIDHKWQSVVVSIRGTLSLEDCVVDVLVDPQPLDDLGNEYGFDGEGQFCHCGVLACVKLMVADLQRHRILESLLSGVGAQYSHYKLRFCGHSLGAGCATMLGYIFRQQFPELRVTAISPPGGFLTWKLASESNEFVTSFVLDSDIVPRLSVATMEQTRNQVLDLIGRIKVPKMNVAKSFVVNGIKKGIKECDDPDEIARENIRILHPRDHVPEDSDFYKQLEKFRAIQKQRKESRGDYRDIKLFPPGKIVHLIKTGERSSCRDSLAKCVTCCTSNSGYEYTPVWADNSDFNEIVVSPTMAFDHFPNRVCHELERVAESFGIDTSAGSSIHDREEGERVRSAHQQYF